MLGSEDGPGALASESPLVRRDAGGRYLVVRFAGSEIKVFDSNGQFVGAVGGSGGGPGEHQMIGGIAISAEGSLYVLDLMPSRWSIYSPDLRFARSNPLGIPPTQDLVLLSDQRAVVAVSAVTPEFAAAPLQFLDGNGKQVRTLGRINASLDAPTNEWVPVIAASGDSAVWLANANRYAMELWSVDGESHEPLLTIERDVSWFPPGLVPSNSVDEPPPPRLVSMRTDDTGHLYVVSHIADNAWRDAVVMRGREIMVTDRNGYVDSMIEVIDTKSGKLLASLRSPLPLGSFVADAMLAAGMSDERAVPYVHVFRLQFRE